MTQRFPSGHGRPVPSPQPRGAARPGRLGRRLIASLLAVTLGALATPAVSAADKTETAAAAVEARLLQSAEYLASDDLQGRGVGTEGLDRAAEYLAQQFAEAGLKTNLFDGKPFQPFQITVESQLGPVEKNRLVFLGPEETPGAGPKKVELTLGETFNTLALGGTGQAEAPLVFAGYGIVAPELKYDDYAGLDVRDKIVLIVRKAPQQDNPHSPFAGQNAMRHALFTTKVAAALDRGAKAVILINDAAELRKQQESSERDWEKQFEQLSKLRDEFAQMAEPSAEQRQEYRGKVAEVASRLVELNKQLAEPGDPVLPFDGAGNQSSFRSLPVFFCSRSAVEPVIRAALGKELSELEREIDQGLEPRSAELTGWSVLAQSQVDVQQAQVKNVVGVLEGAGPLADETVVVGAHYDHVGLGGRGSGSLAEWTVAVHNGADDNASGTAALLEVARRLAANPQAPRRRIVFIAFTGEERGLLGSAHYVREPRFPLESTVAMVNMDMVGRLKDEKLIVYGTGTAKGFSELIDELNADFGFDITKEPGGFGPSDHASFYSQKIPVFHLFTGTHEDYHRPSDDAEKLNVAGMRRIAELVTGLVTRLATAEGRPEYVAIAAPQRGGGPRVYLGSIPDFGRQVEGYALMGVAPGSPADKAGLRAGDVIIKLGEATIRGLEDIDLALRKQKPGDQVNVIVLRGEEQVTLKVTLGERK
ncbi:MAG: M20/M25/M40 family metallo-hydrolase [Pirellulaceae bacterium]|nr:M20/M25/M40 family metallo-hydrolase [Pirellulaceae bacterium]